MAKKKYYAVKKGKTPGIYETWDECSRNVTAVPGAVYKSFGSIEEAREFIGDVNEAAQSVLSTTVGRGTSGRAAEEIKSESGLTEEKREELIRYMQSKLSSSEAVAFVDGSYDKDTGDFAYGMLVYHDGTYAEFSEKFHNDDRNSMHNVAGEIEGSMHAMRYALEQGIASISIYYDYEGIEKWCTGAWKTNKEGTIAYRDYYLGIKDRLKVYFIKVKGHSGDPGNERADSLARQALEK